MKHIKWEQQIEKLIECYMFKNETSGSRRMLSAVPYKQKIMNDDRERGAIW